MKKNTITNGAILGENIAFSKELNRMIEDGLKDILTQAKRYKNSTIQSASGFIAEAYHCANYNIKSVLNREFTRAFREKNGNRGDYYIKDMLSEKIAEKGEMKYYSTAKSTENAMRGYGERKLIGPREQIEKIKTIARKRELKNRINRPKVAKEHATVHRNVKESIGEEKTSSTPISLKEARRLAKRAKRGKVELKDVVPDLQKTLMSSVKNSAVEGAKNGAILGAAVAIAENTYAIKKGEKDLKAALKDISVSTAKSGLNGAVKNVTSNVVKTASLQLAEKTGNAALKSVLKSGAPVAVAHGALEVGKHTYDFVRGKIDKKEYICKSKKTVVGTAGGWAGAEAGAALGTMVLPGIGTIAGGLIGGIVGTLAAERIVS